MGVQSMKTYNEIKNWMSENGYEMVQSLNGVTWCCVKNFQDGTTKTVWDDSACEEAYDEEAATFVAYDVIQEQPIGELTAWDLMFAVYTYNADPAIVENDEEAEELLASIKKSGYHEVTDVEEYRVASEKLDFASPSLVKHIYQFADGLFAVSGDYGD